MSFFVVPAVSYQTQQKINKHKEDRAKQRKKKRNGHRSLQTNLHLTDSAPDDASIVSSAAPSVKSQSLSKGIEESVSEESTNMETSNVVADKFSNALASNSGSSTPPHGKNDGLDSLFSSTRKSSSFSDLAAIPIDRNRNNSALSATSAGSATSNTKYRRNSSLSSSHSNPNAAPTGQPKQSRFSRKLSSPFIGDAKLLPKEAKQLVSPSIKMSPTQLPKQITTASLIRGDGHPVIAPFKPVILMSVLNKVESMQAFLFTPSFQIFRYNNFLDILSDHHYNDPINFARVRSHSLLKFINRHRKSSSIRNRFDTLQHHDIRAYESILAYESLNVRKFLRILIREELIHSHHPIINNEELVQVNFSNYVRYLINLPSNVNPSTLTEVERTHYKYKDFFRKIADALYSLKQEDMGDGCDVELTKVNLLLHSITKVSYEYILLEKYNIQILGKFHNNCILASQSLRGLFEKYKEKITSQDPESTKVLIYNTFYSVQYGWYLALTVPFVRVFETNIYAENPKIIDDLELYAEIESRIRKQSFVESDKLLFDDYFKKLQFEEFSEYKSMPPEKLVNMAKAVDNESAKYSDVNRHEYPDPSASFSHKPMNFEFYSESLSTLESNSFDLIHSRDLQLQLTPTNYKIVLREFYRILKVGGKLETPIVKYGNESIFQGAKDGKPQWDFMEIDLANFLKIIPNFIEVLLVELYEIFGKGNVKFSVVLLSSSNEVNNFLIRRIGIQLFEIFGKIDEYCAKFKDHDDPVKPMSTEGGIHYYINICAQKSQL